MPNMIIAYVLIAVLLSVYGVSVYVRSRQTDAALRALDADEEGRP